MKYMVLAVALVLLLSVPVRAENPELPTAPESPYGPEENQSFSAGLWYVLRRGAEVLVPSFAEAGRMCFSVLAAVLLVGLLQSLSPHTAAVTELAGTVTVGLLLLQPANSLIRLGSSTVRQISEYGKLLLPVMTASLAAQGGFTASTALYGGTAVFDGVLTGLIARVIVPMVYVYLCLSVAAGAMGEPLLRGLRDFVKWAMTWSLKIVLYVFTGYMGITGVISGTADAAALKATRLTLSGMVPVVGGILSDASEAVLVGAGVMKNAAGVYGVLAVLGMFLEPFLRIGTQYLLLKLTAALCTAMGAPRTTGVVRSFSGAMGLLLAMTGAVCLMQLISVVCFMKGIL